jgi:branched-chain amino acid transport system substrate-binding protein
VRGGWKEYPNYEAEGGYTGLYILKTAIEKANRLVGGWPDDNAIIAALEGLLFPAPAGYIYIRPDNHQGYKDGLTGFSMNSPDYASPIHDPKRLITVPIRSITASPGWPPQSRGPRDPAPVGASGPGAWSGAACAD